MTRQHATGPRPILDSSAKSLLGFRSRQGGTGGGSAQHDGPMINARGRKRVDGMVGRIVSGAKSSCAAVRSRKARLQEDILSARVL